MNVTLIEIAEHTIDVDRLTPGGWVLDAGCRDFGFTRGMTERGCRVLALDADPTIDDPKLEKVSYCNFALSDRAGIRDLVMSRDPQARYVQEVGSSKDNTVLVEAVTIADLMAAHGIKHFDVLKLDIEGSEYDILKTLRPIATQISIEFHEHCSPRPQEVYDAIFKHLAQWYEVVQHKKEARYCCHPNWWDTLLVLRS